MEARQLRDALVARAEQLGFVGVGVTGIEPFAEARDRGLDAVRSGRLDGMPWFSEKRVERSSNPAYRFPWARSIVAVAWPYRPALTPLMGVAESGGPGRPRGRFAAYACMDDAGAPADYHRVLRARLDTLMTWLGDQRREPLRFKRFIDHGWAIDRAIAERAGMGFCGKHAGLLTPGAGSYVVLAAAVVSATLEPDRPSPRNCGTCRACIPACPTGAILAPGVIDARRCISYLTIEHEGPIPLPLRPLMGTWAFGCDLCQEACPINARLAPNALPPGPGTTRHGPVPFPDLIELLEIDEAEFVSRFAGTAVARSGRARLARNAAVALGNAGDSGALAALRHAAVADPDDSVREAALWGVAAIETRLSAGEPEPDVQPGR